MDPVCGQNQRCFHLSFREREIKVEKTAFSDNIAQKGDEGELALSVFFPPQGLEQQSSGLAAWGWRCSHLCQLT